MYPAPQRAGCGVLTSFEKGGELMKLIVVRRRREKSQRLRDGVVLLRLVIVRGG